MPLLSQAMTPNMKNLISSFTISKLKVTHLSKKAHSKRLYYVRMIGNQKSVDIAIKPTLVCGQSSCRDRVSGNGRFVFLRHRYYKATLQRFLHTRCTTRSYKAMLPVRSLCYYEPRFHTALNYFYRLKLSIHAQQL